MKKLMMMATAAIALSTAGAQKATPVQEAEINQILQAFSVSYVCMAAP